MVARLASAGSAALIVCLVSTGGALAGPISGVVRTTVREGVVPATSIVYAEPIAVQASRQPGRFTLRQKNKTSAPATVW